MSTAFDSVTTTPVIEDLAIAAPTAGELLPASTIPDAQTDSNPFLALILLFPIIILVAIAAVCLRKLIRWSLIKIFSPRPQTPVAIAYGQISDL